MPSSERPTSFWFQWLHTVAIGVAIFGLALVLAPRLSCEGFSLLVYADPSRIAAFGSEAVAYIALAHAVLGAVMFGWGVALLIVIRGPFRRGEREGWLIIAVSVGAWFAPDTVFSLWSGFGQNVVLNVVFAVLFAVPLAATYRMGKKKRA